MVGVGTWCLDHMKAIDKDYTFSRGLYTNGHFWKIFEIHDNYVKKSDWFKP